MRRLFFFFCPKHSWCPLSLLFIFILYPSLLSRSLVQSALLRRHHRALTIGIFDECPVHQPYDAVEVWKTLLRFHDNDNSKMTIWNECIDMRFTRNERYVLARDGSLGALLSDSIVVIFIPFRYRLFFFTSHRCPFIISTYFVSDKDIIRSIRRMRMHEFIICESRIMLFFFPHHLHLCQLHCNDRCTRIIISSHLYLHQRIQSFLCIRLLNSVHYAGRHWEMMLLLLTL